MSSRYALEHWEIGLIKAMLSENRYTKQHILSYFTRPGRDLNHTVVTAIENGSFGSNISQASQQDYEDFVGWRRATDPHHFAWGGGRVASFQTFDFEYTFHPVGQGLFTSGWFSRTNLRPFHWVYDCGTSNSSKLLSTAMANLKTSVGSGRKLDLVAISHFDADHVNGLLDLLKAFRVGILLLPYLIPWQRMRIALFEDAALGSPLFNFLLAPTAMALGTAEGAGAGIERILLVPPGDGPVPTIDLPGPFDRGSSPDDGPLPEPSFKGKRPPDEQDDSADEGDSLDTPDGDPGLRNARVSMLAPQSSITVGRYWEFVPYNDANLAPTDPPAFQAKAAPWVRTLRKTKDPKVARKCLSLLQNLFRQTFGEDSEGRNRISLFLYSGPLGDPTLLRSTERCDSTQRAPWSYGPGSINIRPNQFGQLLTGDGYLDDRARLDAFLRHYGPARIARGGCFQVMHHGSKNNWFPGVAAAIDPAISLFSSDPTRGSSTRHSTSGNSVRTRTTWCHPDAEVWNDFAPHHPRQIDKTSGWSLSGAFLLV